MSPNDIEVLIHCYCCAGNHPIFDAPAVQDAIKMLLDEGLVYWAEDMHTYMATRKGDAHIKQLCSLPFPREAFLRFDGEEIII